MERKKSDLERFRNETRDYPRLIHLEDQESLVRQNTIFLRNSSEFLAAAQKVTEYIKPVLYHFYLYIREGCDSAVQNHNNACKTEPQQALGRL